MKGIIVFVIALASLAFGAEKQIQLKDLPAAVQQAVQRESAGAIVKGYTVEIENGATEYEAEMMVNGHGKDVSFDRTGKVISIEEEVAIDSIPAAARGAIQKAAAGAKIQKIETVIEKGKSFFEASFRKGNKTIEVQVDSAGNIIK
jgi:uncharacterized membrane protein YkoI